jgi:hypothetical protein
LKILLLSVTINPVLLLRVARRSLKTLLRLLRGCFSPASSNSVMRGPRRGGFSPSQRRSKEAMEAA